MDKIEFNALAIGIADYGKCSDMSHALQLGAPVTIVVRDASIKPLLQRLGFTDIQCLRPIQSSDPVREKDVNG